MKKSLKIFSLFIAIFMLLNVGVIFASAETAESEILSTESTSRTQTPREHYIVGTPGDDEITAELGKGEKTLEELSKINIDDVDFPDFIPYENIIEKEHVNRLEEQEEDLNTIIYQNRDGSKTRYRFANAVKYIDSNGNIRDRSTKISVSTNQSFAYAMENNSLKAYFSQSSNGGVVVEYSGYTISMRPLTSSALSDMIGFDEAKNIITYQNAFGNGTELVYKTLLSGLKEDIVLTQYSGQNIFEFELRAIGLNVAQNDGVWQLVDGEGNSIAEFSDIIVKDSNGKMIVGEMEIIEISEGCFKMTVTVSEGYLTSPSTVYPVYVDPTIYVYEQRYESDETLDTVNTIIDVVMYDCDEADIAPDAGAHDIGGSNPEGRIVIKFPDFYAYGDTDLRSINRYQISNATLNLYVETNKTVTLSIFPMSYTWDPTVYGAFPDYLGYDADLWVVPDDIYSPITKTVTQSGTVSINMTDIAECWADYNNGVDSEYEWLAENGICIMASDSCTVRASDYSGEWNDMYLTVDYSDIGGEYYVYNLNTYKFLKGQTSGLTLGSYSTANTNKWVLDYKGSNKFTVYPLAAPSRWLYASGTSVSLSYNWASATDLTPYEWTLSTATGGGKKIKNVSSNYILKGLTSSCSMVSASSTGNAVAWGMVRCAEYRELTDITLSDDWLMPNTSKYFTINATPSDSSWKSENFFNCTVTGTGVSCTASSSDILLTGSSAGIVTLTLTHKLTGFSKSFTIKCGAVRDGEYKVRNRGSGLYMEVPSTSSGAYVQQGTSTNSDEEKWIFTLLSGGVYSIQSVYSGLFIQPNSTVDGADIVQGTNSTIAAAQWYIEETDVGVFKIVPSYTTNLSLKVPNNSTVDETTLVQDTYIDDTYYYDEWYVENNGAQTGIYDSTYYTIRNLNSGKVLAVKDASTADGSNIIQDAESSMDEQKIFSQTWQLWYIGDGDYRIRDVASGKFLSVQSSSSSIGANIQLETYTGAAGQKFRLRENSDGSFSILTKSSAYTKVIGIPDSSVASGASVKQLDDGNSINLKFSLVAEKLVFYICSIGGIEAGSNGPFGHSWIEIINTTNKNLSAGYYEIQVGEHITIGRWKATDTKVEGIWYNRESYEYHNLNKYHDLTAVRIMISIDSLEKLSSYTRTNNFGYGGLANNCTHYAVIAWNMVTGEDKNIQFSYVSVSFSGVPAPGELQDFMYSIMWCFEDYDMIVTEQYGYFDKNKVFHPYS